MSDLLGGGGIPVARNAGEGAGSPTAGGSDLPFGVARNANVLQNITSGGERLTEAGRSALISAVVVQEINVPAMCQIMFEMGERWSDADFNQFTPGKKLVIPSAFAQDATATAVNDVTLAPMYVAGMKLDATGGRSMLTVTAFDKLHYLRFGAYTNAFTKKTDQDIFEQLIEPFDLSLAPPEQLKGLRIEPYPYVLQDNETNYDFLLRRCREANYECMVSSEQGQECLIVRKCEQGGAAAMVEGKVLRLAYKTDVAALTLDMRVPTLGANVTSRGYDASSGAFPKGSSREDMGNTTSEQKDGFDLAVPFEIKRRPTGASPPEGQKPLQMTLRRPDLNDLSSLDFVAQAEREHHLNTLIEGSATLRRVNLHAHAGVNFYLAGTGTPFDGLYYIVKSEHRFERHGDRSILELRRSAISWLQR